MSGAGASPRASSSYERKKEPTKSPGSGPSFLQPLSQRSGAVGEGGSLVTRAEHCREVFFGSWLELRLPDSWGSSTVFHQGMAIGDLFLSPPPSPREQLLAVASVEGHLCLFRPSLTSTRSSDNAAAFLPFWTSSQDPSLRLTGTLCALEIGDVFGSGRNSLVCANVEGVLFILTSSPPTTATTTTPPSTSSSAVAVAVAAADAFSGLSLQPSSPPGPIFAPSPLRPVPFEGDAPLPPSSSSSSSSSPPPLPTKPSPPSSSTFPSATLNLFRMQQHEIPPNVCVVKVADVLKAGRNQIIIATFDRTVHVFSVELEPSFSDPHCLSLSERGRWTLKGQVATLVATPGSIVASLQAGAFAVIDPLTSDVSYCCSMEGSFDPSGAHTHVAGPLGQDGSLVAVATWDGELRLEGAEVAWTRWVDKQLFSVATLDVTGDGNDEVIATTMEGLTFIARASDGDTVSFQFPHSAPITVFHCGSLSLPDSPSPQPCLMYSTFHRDIFVYYDLHLRSIDSYDLYDRIMQECPQLTEDQLDNLLLIS